jgi:aryl-alcohol dehydrogenase-like predicted oxidoreductase
MDLTAKIGLGTVQWGLTYGIANRDGRPADVEVARMLDLAAAAGIRLLDTAYAYGEAEDVIGRAASKTSRLVTKTLPIQADAITPAHIEEIDQAFHRSLVRLQRPNVDGLLVHAAQNLLNSGGERLWDWLEKVRAAGLVQRIGVSLYAPEQYDRLRARFPLQLVQIPLNIYDRRFIRSGALRDMAAAGVEVHVRSAFLQGLLLMNPEALPGFCAALRPHHRRLQDWIAAAGLTPLAACLGFSLGLPDVSHVIVGCETAEQLRGIIQASRQAGAADIPEEFALEDEAILNPALWPSAR